MTTKFIDRHPFIVSALVYTLYKVVLEMAYIFAVSPTFGYMGFLTTPNWSKCILTYIIMLILIVFIPRSNSIRGQLINLFFTTTIIPLLSYYWLCDKDNFILIGFVLFISIVIMVLHIKKVPLVIINGNSEQYKLILEVIFWAYIVLSLYLGLKRGGIDPRAFSFDSVYDLRKEYNGTGSIDGYLLNWCVKALFPTLSAYYLYKKKTTKVAICIALQVFIYLCYGQKSYLLSSFFLIAIYCIGSYVVKHHNDGNSFRNQIMFIIALIPNFFIYFEGLLAEFGKSIRNVYTMRMLFEPARIATGYFEYFSINPKLYFSEGLIGKLFGLNYPYSEPIGFVITRYLAGSGAVSNSNTGIIGDSYAQLGFLGIIIIALLTGFLIRFVERITIHLPNYITVAAMCYPIIMLNDNPLLTNLLTNGWVLDIIMLIIIEGALRDDTALNIQ